MDATNANMNTAQPMNPLNRELTIIFCITGDSFSNKFLLAWTTLFNYCLTHGIRPLISNYTGKTQSRHHTRNMCLGSVVKNGLGQQPFNGEIPYDFVMFIDSERMFGVEDFINLLSENKDVVSGGYLIEKGTEKVFDVVKDCSKEVVTRKGGYDYLTIDEVVVMKKKQENHLLSVDYMGSGWMLLKKGVLESLSYPWFKSEPNCYDLVDPSGNSVSVIDTDMEMWNFCNTLRSNGYTLNVSLNSLVGTERLGLL